MPNFPDSSVIATGFNPGVVSAAQDRTLQRTFRDALYPRQLYRMEAVAELWPVNLGQNQTFTRTALIQPTTQPLLPGTDPVPSQYGVEQWECTAQPWGGAIDTEMPTSYVTLASQYLRNNHQLGCHAGQSMNRVVRDKLFNNYVSGNTVTTGSGTSATVTVQNLAGLCFTIPSTGGRPTAVSASNPLSVTINLAAGAVTANITAATPAVAGDYIHAGSITLDQTITWLGREAVLAVNRARLLYSGGGTRVDDVASSDQFRMADIRAAVAQMRFDNVPPFEDGTYHCHLDPISESQIFGDNEFQRLNQSIPDYIHYRRFALAFLAGCTFYRNTEAPTTATVSENPQFGHTTAFELTNPTGVTLHRPIFLGQGCIEEKYLDQSRLISDAGVQGKIGEFAVVNGGMQILTERIRLILRAPLNRLQTVTGSAWSFFGDFGVPTDALSLSSPANFKRAAIVVHGS